MQQHSDAAVHIVTANCQCKWSGMQAAGIGCFPYCASCASKATASPGAISEFTRGSLKQGNRWGEVHEGLTSSSKQTGGDNLLLPSDRCSPAASLFPRQDYTGSAAAWTQGLLCLQTNVGRMQGSAGTVAAARLGTERSNSCSDWGKMCGREQKRARHGRILHAGFCFTKGWINPCIWHRSECPGSDMPEPCEGAHPVFCLPALMRADSGIGLPSRDCNQCCPKPSESH